MAFYQKIRKNPLICVLLYTNWHVLNNMYVGSKPTFLLPPTPKTQQQFLQHIFLWLQCYANNNILISNSLELFSLVPKISEEKWKNILLLVFVVIRCEEIKIKRKEHKKA